MKTIEIKSIDGKKKSIEIILDGVSNTFPSFFRANTQKGNIVAVKFDDSSIPTIFIDRLSKLTVNGESFSSTSDAAAAINELSNFKSGGNSSSENNGGGITKHNDLTGRTEPNSHPVSSITGLEKSLKELQEGKLDKDTVHNELTERDQEDAHPIAAITGLEEELEKKTTDLQYSENVEFLPVIKNAEGLSGNFLYGGAGPDGKPYFSGWNFGGIAFRDHDGIIKITNKGDDNFLCLGAGKNRLLYFGSRMGRGIWYVDVDGTVKQHPNAASRSYFLGAAASDGTLYFVGETSIARLENDGSISVLYVSTTAVFSFGSKLEELQDEPGGDDDRVIAGFNSGGGAGFHNNKLYVASDWGVKYFDLSDNQVYNTNINSYVKGVFVDRLENKLYILGSSFGNGTGSGGILYLDETDNLIKPTNKNTSSATAALYDRTGVLYFVIDGLYYRDPAGLIQKLSSVNGPQSLALDAYQNFYVLPSSNLNMYFKGRDEVFKAIYLSVNKSFNYGFVNSDGTLYFCTSSGISYLETPLFVREINRWKEIQHSDLPGRDSEDSHPINAITGLEEALAGKQEKPANDDIPKIALNGNWIEAAHNSLTERDAEDCHPIEAITGLEEALAGVGTTKNKVNQIQDAVEALSIRIDDVEEEVASLSSREPKSSDTPSTPAPQAAPLSTTPHLWEVNTEIDLGDGSFGRRFKGERDGGYGEILCDSGMTFFKIIDSGGYAMVGKIMNGSKIIWSLTLPLGTYSPDNTVGAYLSFMYDEFGGYFSLVISQGSNPQQNLAYDIWVRYIKS